VPAAQNWIEAIGARSLGKRPFEARGRKTEPLGPPTSVEHIGFDYRQWDGPKLEWAKDFGKGKGQVYSLDGTRPRRSCNEVEVAKRMRRIRDNAYWFSGYQPGLVPELWRPWVRSLKGEVPEWLKTLNAEIRSRIRSPAGGMPDVVAWNDVESLRSALFVECKGWKEPFDEAQEDWVWGARQARVRISQIAVSVRPF
jgi:VRR-NUC domain-containing protein